MRMKDDELVGTWKSTVLEEPRVVPAGVVHTPKPVPVYRMLAPWHSSQPLHSPVYVRLAEMTWVVPLNRVTIVPLKP